MTYLQCGPCGWDKPPGHMGRCPKCGSYAFEEYTLEHLKPPSDDVWDPPPNNPLERPNIWSLDDLSFVEER